MGRRVFSDDEVSDFVRRGAVRLDGAFPLELADECRRLLWSATGCRHDDPASWTRPVIRIPGRADAPFRAAAGTARLQAAFDQLAGVGRWRPLDGLGTFPIRFPVAEPPGDDGWHIEATSSNARGEAIVDPASRERVLLLLFLFSEVGSDDAPTRIRLGSHLTAARLLWTSGEPRDFFRVASEVESHTAALPEVAATGRPGDVWLCHPYVLHAGQAHRGSQVKFMAQPPLAGTGPIDPRRPVDQRSPVEAAVHLALHAKA